MILTRNAKLGHQPRQPVNSDSRIMSFGWIVSNPSRPCSKILTLIFEKFGESRTPDDFTGYFSLFMMFLLRSFLIIMTLFHIDLDLMPIPRSICANWKCQIVGVDWTSSKNMISCTIVFVRVFVFWIPVLCSNMVHHSPMGNSDFIYALRSAVKIVARMWSSQSRDLLKGQW
jgi:hypothetical protein